MTGRRLCWTWRDQNWLAVGITQVTCLSLQVGLAHTGQEVCGLGSIDIVHPPSIFTAAGAADMDDRVEGVGTGARASNTANC